MNVQASLEVFTDSHMTQRLRLYLVALQASPPRPYSKDNYDMVAVSRQNYKCKTEQYTLFALLFENVAFDIYYMQLWVSYSRLNRY